MWSQGGTRCFYMHLLCVGCNDCVLAPEVSFQLLLLATCRGLSQVLTSISVTAADHSTPGQALDYLEGALATQI